MDLESPGFRFSNSLRPNVALPRPMAQHRARVAQEDARGIERENRQRADQARQQADRAQRVEQARQRAEQLRAERARQRSQFFEREFKAEGSPSVVPKEVQEKIEEHGDVGDIDSEISKIREGLFETPVINDTPPPRRKKKTKRKVGLQSGPLNNRTNQKISAKICKFVGKKSSVI